MAWFPHISFVEEMTPGQKIGLREKPAAAVARVAAPYFFALRERRRRLGDQEVRGASAPAGLSKPRRSRPRRLRDRIRAVSHRLSTCRLQSLEVPQTTKGELQDIDSDQGSPKKLSSQQLVKPTRWEKRKVKPVFTSDSLRVRLVHGYLLHVYSRAHTAAQYVNDFFCSRGLLGTEIYREARFMARTLDDLQFKDKLDLFHSKGAENFIRRLYGLEQALHSVTCEAMLEHVDWKAVDAYDLPELSEASQQSVVEFAGVRAEAKKRLLARQRLRKVLKIWPRAHGIVFETMTKNCPQPIEYDHEDLRILRREIEFEM